MTTTTTYTVVEFRPIGGAMTSGTEIVLVAWGFRTLAAAEHWIATRPPSDRTLLACGRDRASRLRRHYEEGL